MTKHIKISDFLNSRQIRLAQKLKHADLIYEQITLPNIKSINQKLGQENDPRYLAYAIEYAVNMTSAAAAN